MDSREQNSWVFRHIGPPPTIAGAAEVVELKQGATTFGRGGSSDVYIDSLLLQNFISRCHAVVVGERNDDGQLQFVLHNHGLNGTYINDVRIGKIHHLREGDKIIFGHKNGYKVKVGETAEQPDSEFQFVFEQRQPNKSAITPLQEHRRQEEISGDTVLSNGDVAEPAVYTPRRNGPLVLEKGFQQVKDSSHKKDKSLYCENSSEGRSRSPLGLPPESQRSKSLEVDHDSDSEKKFREVSGKESPKRKSETNKGPLKGNDASDEVSLRVEEVNVAKENKARSSSPYEKKTVDKEKKTVFRRCDEDDGGKTVLSKKLSCEGVKTKLPARPNEGGKSESSKAQSEGNLTTSSQQKIVQDSARCTPIKAEDKQSVLSKQVKSEVSSTVHRSKPEFLEKMEKEKSPCTSSQPGSPRYRDSSRSPRQLGRSRLPSSETPEHRSRSPLRSELREKRMGSPVDKAFGNRSRSLTGKSRIAHPRSRSLKPDSASKSSASSESGSTSRSSSSDSSRSSERRSSAPEKQRRSPNIYDEPPVLSPKYDIKTPSPCGFIGRTFNDEDFDEMDDMDKESLLYSVPPTPGHSLRDLSPSPHQSRRDISPETKTDDVSVWERDRDRSAHSTCQSRKRDRDSGYRRSGSERTMKHSVSRSPKNHSRPVRDRSSRERDSQVKSRRKSEDSFCDQKRKKSFSSRSDYEHTEPDSTTVHRDHNGTDSDSAGSFKRRKGRSDEKCSENKHGWRDPDEETKKSMRHGSCDTDTQQKDYRNKTKGKSKDSPLPATVVGRNVFDEFSSSEQQDSDLYSSVKRRQHSSRLDVSNSSDNSSRTKFKSSKANPKPYKSFGEKENGPTPRKESSGKYTGYTDRNREKQQSDGKLLKDVRVSVQRVGLDRHSSSKHKSSDVDRKQKESKSVAEDGISTYGGQNKQPSRPTKGDKTSSRGRQLSTDTSLFGLEMERLSSVPRRERNKTSRDKTVRAKGGKPASSRDEKDNDKVKRKLSSEQLPPERSREKTRPTSSERKRARESSVSSRSVTPDPLFSTETEKQRPERKVAMRRPRQAKEPSQEEKKPGRPSARKQKQQRKRTKTKDSGDDNECLEDGVVWYEEDTCESVHCFRPADRRVQWVCCDDCDKWYHTVCVGIINLDELKDEDYHCGCTDE